LESGCSYSRLALPVCNEAQTNAVIQMIAKILNWINVWKQRGYPYDIPDEAPEIFEKENMVPSYRMICLAIMKNDTRLKTLGYDRVPCKAYTAIKKIELAMRGKIKNLQKQLELFK
jgi:predicted phosphoadenosine phosphosulfate sulfurtransferase